MVAAGAGWTEASAGPFRATAIAIAATFVVCASGVVMSADEPPFLRAWLPPRGVRGDAARAFVVVLWALPPVVLASLSVGLRLGAQVGAGVARGACLGLAIAVLLALATSRARERGLALYAPIAAVSAAALVLGIVR